VNAATIIVGKQMTRAGANLKDRTLYIDVFNALSDPIRLEIISQCAVSDECACTVLEEILPVAKSTISYHVKILYHAGLIEVRKDGRFYHYGLRREFLEGVLPGFLDRLSSWEQDPTLLSRRVH
jgi:ArsR family transcriptional regulator